MGLHKACVCKGGNFHRHWYPEAPKEHESSLQVHFLKDGFSWLVWFTVRLPCCPDKGTKGPVPPTLVHTGRHCSWGTEHCHPSRVTLGTWKGLTHFHLWNGCCEDGVVQNRESFWHSAHLSTVAEITTTLAVSTEQPYLMWESSFQTSYYTKQTWCSYQETVGVVKTRPSLEFWLYRGIYENPTFRHFVNG